MNESHAVPTIAIQQLSIAPWCTHPKAVKTMLSELYEQGYRGIECNAFMLKPLSFGLRLMTYFSGMPVGNVGSLPWFELIADSGLSVPSVHIDLSSIEQDIEQAVQLANQLHTSTITITGMYRFNYASKQQVDQLITRLHNAGAQLKQYKINLLYHNHNIELLPIQYQHNGQTITTTVLQYLIEHTDPELVNFELDSTWIAASGTDALAYMKMLNTRMILWHINDYGVSVGRHPVTPILKTRECPIGLGNMPLAQMVQQSIEQHCRSIIVESHYGKRFNDWHDIFSTSATHLQHWLSV